MHDSEWTLKFVIWPTMSCFSDWSKYHHVTFIIIEWSSHHGRPCVIIMIRVTWPFIIIMTQSCDIHYTHTHLFNGPFSRTARVGRYQKDKTNLGFTEARDSEWQWHQLGHMQVCTSLQTDNHSSASPLIFLQAGCPSCRPTNSVKALKAHVTFTKCKIYSML